MTSFCRGELYGKATYGIHEDEDAVEAASVWMTDKLNLSFSTMEDLETAIKSLQGLRSKVQKHLKDTGRQWTPSSLYDKAQNVDVSVHKATYYETEMRENGKGASYFEALTMAERQDERMNDVTFYFPHGQKGVIKKFAREILGEVNRREGDDDNEG
jgi:Mor family transcriptional regulator